ncbi:hypothetical protein L1049_005670 [Liquidambar formosana]|uniref:Uncharacterized protein n=1 Tax=Liquidambar formosana TaxID=63359 RepID=A0AAP0RE16_LIQFO
MSYVQQLETSHLKLIQIEQELERARQQGLYIGGGLDATHLEFPGTINTEVKKRIADGVQDKQGPIFPLMGSGAAFVEDFPLNAKFSSVVEHNRWVWPDVASRNHLCCIDFEDRNHLFFECSFLASILEDNPHLM